MSKSTPRTSWKDSAPCAIHRSVTVPGFNYPTAERLQEIEQMVLAAEIVNRVGAEGKQIATRVTTIHAFIRNLMRYESASIRLYLELVSERGA
ncbi:hypothetical protein EVAR_51950_1 [Eumeta japonica]|uniref:Uncharacterized protein n=1 Tax=Eumeta variegata TaxID=151549 RepID=A0A4C1YG63_EUMVA|nr:hypothetical protein EVAR_51950_1 [Eumeta japonica]